jgi:hypothetical protein
MAATTTAAHIRIEVVFNRARALGHIDEDRANPARWKGHLDKQDQPSCGDALC